ncbi:MAG TPA: LPXTG cell wall anchor domain-containing protein, partial [Acidimicrobiales bacterium]
PETPVPAPALPSLPYTGGPAAWQAALGGAFLLSGGILLLAARQRKRPAPDATSVRRPGGRAG